MMLRDRFDLERFVSAQNADRTYERAVAELRDGRKRTHWMWFVYPQIAGLGQSATSQRYAIASLEEARAYRQHPVLGPRLVECARIIAATAGDRSVRQILGGIDAQKLHSSMTLFAQAEPEDRAFAAVLDRFFDGTLDRATLDLLGVGRADHIPSAPRDAT